MLHFPRNHYDVPRYIRGCDCFLYVEYRGTWLMDDHGNSYQVNQLNKEANVYLTGELH